MRTNAKKLRVLSTSLTLTLALVFSLMAAIVPGSPARADPMQTVNISFDMTITVDGNYRAHGLVSGDEVVQFTRTNLTVGTSPSGGFHTATTSSGTVSGDLSGTMTAQHNSLDIWWNELAGAGKGYAVGTFTFDDGAGNTFSGIQVGDIDYTYISPGVVKSDNTGYMFSPSGTGAFAGQVLIGTYSASTGVGDPPDYTRAAGTATLRRYASREVSGPSAFSFSGTATMGNQRSLGASLGPAANDEFVQFTRSNITITKGDPATFEEGASISATMTGALTGTMTDSRNTISIPGTDPVYQGWSVGKFSYSDGSGTMSGIEVVDALGGTAPFNATGYMFALHDAGTTTGAYGRNDYYATFDSATTGTPPSLSISGSGSLYTMARLTVPTATGRGIASFSSSAGTVEGLTSVAEATLPEAGKPNLNFPLGFFSFNITGLTPGQTVTVTITLPSPVPVGTQYWKYHASEGGWIQIPMGSDDGDNVITITLVDGGLGDDDGVADGTIVDQGGPGNPLPVGGEVYPIDKLSVLGPWIGFALTLILVTIAGMLALRRRRSA